MPNFKSFSPKVLHQYDKCQVHFFQRTLPTMPNFKSFSSKVLTSMTNVKSFFSNVLYPLCQISSPFLPRYLTSMTNIKSFFSNVLYPLCQISRKVLDQYAKCQVLFFQRTRLVRPTNLMSRMDGKKTHTHTHTLPTMPNFKSFSSKVLDQYAKFQVLFSQRT